MKIIYIAGPFRGPTAWHIAENIRAAERLGLLVANAGGMPLIPHANCAHFHGQLDDQFWLDGTTELLRRCDGVVLVPGWVRSSGTKAELEEAKRLGIPHLDCEGIESHLLKLYQHALKVFVDGLTHRGKANQPEELRATGPSAEDRARQASPIYAGGYTSGGGGQAPSPVHRYR